MAVIYQAPYSNVMYTIVSPVLGALIIILNCSQYFCVKRIQRAEGRGSSASANLVYIKSLCASDILAGVTMVVLKSMDPFMSTTLKGK